MAAKGIEAGFTAMLTKPIRKTTLLEALVPYAPVGRALPPARVLVEEGMEDAVPAYLDKRRAEIPVYRQALRLATSKPFAASRTRPRERGRLWVSGTHRTVRDARKGRRTARSHRLWPEN